jgi:hypothetical protein
MANTFKLVTKANVTSADTIYTVAGSTTTVVLGIMVGNTTTGQITATVSLASDTSSRAGANDEANVMEATDTLSLTATGSADIAISMMEIT